MINLKNCVSGSLFIVGFFTLISLGFWQVDRLKWKQSIISQLESIYAQDASNVTYNFDDLNIKTSKQNIPILYGSLRGRFDYSKEILVGPKAFEGQAGKQIGYQIITPLTLIKGGSVFVSRGFISVGNKDKISDTHMRGNITVSGLIREPDWTRFTPKNSPENDVWSRLDIEEIAAFQNIDNIAPMILYAEESSLTFPHITMQSHKWMPRNKHAQYALFWFTMAFVMVGVFGFYARSRFCDLKK